MNKTDFENRRETLRKIDPENSWLEEIEGEYSIAKTVYLKTAARQIGLNLEDPPPVDPHTDTDKLKEASEKEPTKKRTYQTINELMTERARLSNQFHIATNDRERGSISRRIEKVQEKIKKNLRQIDFFKATGENVANQSELDEPVDKFELHKKVQSLRTSISYFKRKLKEATDEEEKKQIREEIRQKMIEKANHEQKIKNI